jgi:hypothetical protein
VTRDRGLPVENAVGQVFHLSVARSGPEADDTLADFRV